ncbi:unnamed protein product [Brassicogethes aeneus]|uniref:Major facilitator superfamily (MFS) profile domain-containing protein n=1 Tax=Brassicogethes aeneus TaxID=1431903 RepID=A0A9P0AUS1_BRAAE|nr:unnamed protein product [Brassicogethes aeneus]
MTVYNNLVHVYENHRKQWPQIVSILISCFSGVVYGLSFAWTSPSIVKITQDKENYNITEHEASYFTIIPYVATTLTILPLSYLNDIIGRKHTIMIMAIPCIIYWIIIIFAKSVYMFYLARLFSGVTEFLFISLLMYVGEISSPTIRGTWGNALYFSVNVGILLINVIGSYNTIQMTAYICLGFCLVFVAIFPFIPDTPYYYIIKNKEQEARTTLKWLYQEEDVEELYQSLKSDVHRQISETGKWRDVFQISTNRKALITGFYMQVSLPFSGLTAFIVQSQQLFQESGGEVSAEASAIIITAIITATSLFAVLTADKLGRKNSFIGSCFLCMVLLFIGVVFFWTEQHHPNLVEGFHWLPLVIMVLFCIIHTIGIGTVGFLMMEELFSASIKTKALMLCTLSFGITGAINNEIFNLLLLNFGLYSAFLYFTFACALLFILSFKLVPETSGKTLEEIQQDLKKNNNDNVVV